MTSARTDTPVVALRDMSAETRIAFRLEHQPTPERHLVDVNYLKWSPADDR